MEIGDCERNVPIASRKVLEIQQPLEQNRFVRGVKRCTSFWALDRFDGRYRIMNSPERLPLESDCPDLLHRSVSVELQVRRRPGATVCGPDSCCVQSAPQPGATILLSVVTHRKCESM